MIHPIVVQTAEGVSGLAGDLASATLAGLSGQGQKTLPSRFLYDDVGSALFEVISRLPEYGLTRADGRILEANASAIIERARGPLRLAELGSGSGIKTRWILDAALSRFPVTYHPIDISAAALGQCAASMVLRDDLEVSPIQSEYLPGLARVAERREPGERLLVLFLGSTIGNFDRPVAERFLANVAQALAPGDTLLLGTDLVKPVDLLLRAYDDPLGVTAAFNLNVLVRLNRELDAHFDLERFEHLARWDANERRVEMHIRSRENQLVAIGAIGLTARFAAGETIWTESSHKFEPDEAIEMGGRAGLSLAGQWVDAEWSFAETLFVLR